MDGKDTCDELLLAILEVYLSRCFADIISRFVFVVFVFVLFVFLALFESVAEVFRLELFRCFGEVSPGHDLVTGVGGRIFSLQILYLCT